MLCFHYPSVQQASVKHSPHIPQGLGHQHYPHITDVTNLACQMLHLWCFTRLFPYSPLMENISYSNLDTVYTQNKYVYNIVQLY